MLPYACNTQLNRSTEKTPFSLVLSRHSPGPTNFDRPSSLPSDADDATGRAVHQSKPIHCNAFRRQKTEKDLTAAQRRYKDHHDRRLEVTATSRPGQWINVEHTALAVKAVDGLTTDSYCKLIPRKLDIYYIFSSTTETVTIDEEVIPITISSDRASLALPPEIDAFATGATASFPSDYPERLRGEYSVTDSPIGTGDAQRRNTEGITLTTSKAD